MAAKDQITNKVDNQPMNNQKLDEISQAQTWKNLKQIEEVDVHEKKKKKNIKEHDDLLSGYIIFRWSHTLDIQFRL